MSTSGVDGTTLLSIDGGPLQSVLLDLNYCLIIAQPCKIPPILGVPDLDINGNVLLGWTAVGGAIAYNIYAAPNGWGPFTLLGTTTTTNYVDLNAIDSTRRFYQIRAICP